MLLERMIRRSDMIRCALCSDAPCTAACGSCDPAGILRSGTPVSGRESLCKLRCAV